MVSKLFWGALGSVVATAAGAGWSAEITSANQTGALTWLGGVAAHPVFGIVAVGNTNGTEREPARWDALVCWAADPTRDSRLRSHQYTDPDTDTDSVGNEFRTAVAWDNSSFSDDNEVVVVGEWPGIPFFRDNKITTPAGK